jgi:hypothetical protein
MIFCQLHGHRMAGSAHFVILWQENKGFRGKTGHRMTYIASIAILWQENESGGGGTLRSRPWWNWKNCFSAGVEQRNRRNGASGDKEVFSRRRCGGGSWEGPPRFAEENFLDGSSSGHSGDEDISSQKSELLKRLAFSS